jgi:hypothetical protein
MGSLFLAERSFRLAETSLAEGCVSVVKRCDSFEASAAEVKSRKEHASNPTSWSVVVEVIDWALRLPSSERTRRAFHTGYVPNLVPNFDWDVERLAAYADQFEPWLSPGSRSFETSLATERMLSIAKALLGDWKGALQAVETEWRWLHRFLAEPVVTVDPTASDPRQALLGFANGFYRVLLRVLSARRRTRTVDALIMHRLSRLHSATPPEGKLLTTSSLSATSQFRRKVCQLSPGVSGLRLAPT